MAPVSSRQKNKRPASGPSAKPAARAVVAARSQFNFMPKLADVAREAGVAISTASAVLGNKDYCAVTDETRARITAACEKLGYKPNPIARAIRNQQTASVGLVLPSLVTNGVLGDQLRALEGRVRASGMSMFVATHQYSTEAEEAALRDQVMRGSDGIVLYPVGQLSQTLKKLIDSRFPLVTIESNLPVHTWNVEVDRFKGGYLQIKHLVARGKRNPVFLAPQVDSRTSANKQSGRLRAMKDEGLVFDEARILRMNPGDSDWARCARETILAALDRGVTFDSVCANSDIVALGAMSALQSRGLHVPKDVAVIGFDDEHFGPHLSPALSTIRQPRNLGEHAFDLLMKQVQNNQQALRRDPEEIRLDPELIARDST